MLMHGVVCATLHRVTTSTIVSYLKLHYQDGGQYMCRRKIQNVSLAQGNSHPQASMVE